MTRSTDLAMDQDEIGATRLQPRMGDDDRKRRGGDTGLPGAPGSAVITKTRPQVKRPNMYRVLLLNDDYTPMEFVVDVLQRFFNKDRDSATRIESCFTFTTTESANAACILTRSPRPR